MLSQDLLYGYYYPGKQQSNQDITYWVLLTKHNCVLSLIPSIEDSRVNQLGTWSEGQQMPRLSIGMQVFCSRESRRQCVRTRGRLCRGNGGLWDEENLEGVGVQVWRMA